MTSAAVQALTDALAGARIDLENAHSRYDNEIERGRIAQGYVDEKQSAVESLEEAIEALTLAKENRMREANDLPPVHNTMIVREAEDPEEVAAQSERTVNGIGIRRTPIS